MNKNKIHIKKPGFTTPKNYFDTLESQIMDKTALICSVSNKNQFQIPKNYFEKLDDRLQNKPSLKNLQPKIISIFRTKTFRYAAGIAAVLLVFISIFRFQQTNNSAANTISEIENYIENGFINISYFDFETLLTDEILEETIFISTINQDDLFEYLSYEIDEINLTNP